MKIKVGKTYLDGVGCTVEIIKKINNDERPYVGIVNWSTADCQSSRRQQEEPELYDANGSPGLSKDFDLIREVTIRRRK